MLPGAVFVERLPPMATAAASVIPAGPTLIGHPRGLFLLFFTEMWERFSYYGMRGLLVFYLTKQLLFADADATLVYGAYTSLVYITPVVGGWLADRYLGGRKAVLAGGVLIATGHFCLALEGTHGTHGVEPGWLQFFFVGLSFIIVGTGLLKANISAIVGTLYARDDPRRDPAYTIFYMGVNLGVIIGAFVCGWLGERVGWNWGFGAAGLGMLAGLAAFVVFRGDLLGRSEPPHPAHLAARIGGVSRELWIYAGTLGGVGVVWLLVQHQAAVGTLLGLFGVALIGYIVWTAVRHLPAVERDRIFAALALIVVSILFWSLYEQSGSSINLFTDRSVDRHVFGREVPASVFQSLSGIWIVTMAPVLAAAWTWLGRRGWDPSAPAKFGLGIVQLGLAFLILVGGAHAHAGAPTPLVFLVLYYLLLSTGELCLSPVGLSAMTKMALPQMAGLLMGTWFFALAAGNFTAGRIASAIGSEGAGPEGALAVYTKVGWIAVGAGLAMLLASPLVKRLMHLDRLGLDEPGLAGQREIGEGGAAGVHVDRELKA